MFNQLLKFATWIGQRKVKALDLKAKRKFDSALKLRKLAAQVIAESEKAHAEGVVLLAQAQATEGRVETLAEV